MATEWTLRFKGENTSVLSKARGTEKALGDVSTKVMRHNKAMASSSEAAARVQGQALQRTRRQTDSASRSFRNAERDIGRMSRGAIAGSGLFRHLGRSIAFASAAFLGTAGFINLVRVSIGRATDLAGSVLRTQIVFGRAAGEVRRWSKTTFDQLGIARAAALSYANAFGQILTTLGLAPREAARASEALTRIGGAISLGAGEKDPSKAMEALTGGITGRGRALKAYGIIIDGVTVKAEAMRLGLVKTAVDTNTVTLAQRRLAEAEAVLLDTRKRHAANSVAVARAEDAVALAHKALSKAVGGSTVALTGQQKAQAALSLITAQSARFTGRYGKLLDTEAGKQRKFTEGTQELEQELGEGLLPIFNRGLVTVNRWIKSLAIGGSRHEQFVRTLGQIRRVLGQTATALQIVARIGDRVARVFGGWETSFKLVLSFYLANKFLSLAAAIRASRLALILVGQQAPKTAAVVIANQTAMAASADASAASIGRIRGALGLLRTAAGRAIVITLAYQILRQFGAPPIQESIATETQGFPGKGRLGAAGVVRAAGIDTSTRRGLAAIMAEGARMRGESEKQIYARLREAGFTRAETMSAIGLTRSTGKVGKAAARAQQAGGGGSVTVARGADRGGVATKPHVIAFVKALSAAVGRPLRITTGTNHNENVAGTNRQSDHWTGNAADIAASGAWLTQLGQAALIVAGADPNWAYKQTGGAYNVGGVNILFNTNIGGNHFNHLHVGLHSLPKSLGGTGAQPQTVTGAQPTDTGPAFQVDHPAARPGRSTAGQVRALRQTLDFIAEHLDDVLSPQLQKRLAQRIASIRKLLAGVVTPRELAAAGKQMTALKTLFNRALDFSQGVRNIRVSMKRISEQIERMPAQARGRLRLQMAVIRKELENVTTQAGLARIRKKLEGIGDAIEAAVEAARTRAEKAQDRLHDVLSTIFDKALEVFDAQTERMVAAVRAQYEALTTAEQALADLERASRETDTGRRREDAQTALARAQRLGDPTMIRDALRELADIQTEERRAALEAQAEVERKAADAAADAEEARIRDERRLMRERFDARLQEMLAGFDDEQGLTQERIQDLVALMKSYGIDFDSAGALIGEAFATGFRDAVSDLVNALNALIDAINEVNRATGKPLIGHAKRYQAPPGRPDPRLMAKGGIVMRPTRALIGERNKPEGVFPLDDPRSIAILRQALGGGGGGGGTVLHFTQVVEGSLIREHDLWRTGAREIEKVLRRNAPQPMVVRMSDSANLGQRRQRQW